MFLKITLNQHEFKMRSSLMNTALHLWFETVMKINPAFSSSDCVDTQSLAMKNRLNKIAVSSLLCKVMQVDAWKSHQSIESSWKELWGENEVFVMWWECQTSLWRQDRNNLMIRVVQLVWCQWICNKTLIITHDFRWLIVLVHRHQRSLFGCYSPWLFSPCSFKRNVQIVLKGAACS